MPMELCVIPDVKAAKALSEDSQKQREGQAILCGLCSRAMVVLLDERGKEFTSREFSE